MDHAPSVSVDDVFEAIKSGEKFILLDVRLPHEYVNGHILDSVLISDYQIDIRMEREIPDKTQTIYIYSRTDNKSIAVTIKLHEIGYQNAYFMQGGLEAWKQKDYPMEE